MDQQAQNNDLKEINIHITDKTTYYYGGNQYWYPSKSHQVSGCGPVAAANITAHLAKCFPEQYSALYPFPTNTFSKHDFISHMVNIRKHVKPGLFGLTSSRQFSENVLSFAKQQSVTLIPHIINQQSSGDEALTFIDSALKQNIPVAMLILTHHSRAISEYVWHWMTIHHYYINELTNKKTIVISSCGERHLVDFDLLWNKRHTIDVIKLVYFN